MEFQLQSSSRWLAAAKQLNATLRRIKLSEPRLLRTRRGRRRSARQNTNGRTHAGVRDVGLAAIAGFLEDHPTWALTSKGREGARIFEATISSTSCRRTSTDWPGRARPRAVPQGRCSTCSTKQTAPRLRPFHGRRDAAAQAKG